MLTKINIDNKCNNVPMIIHILICGDTNVGKSSLVQQYIHNLNESKSNLSVYANLNGNLIKGSYNIESTLVTTDMKLYSENSSNVQLQILDLQVLPGQFPKLSKMFQRNKVVIFMYDVTCIKSFNDIKERWFVKTLPQMRPIFLIGNKMDTDSDFIVDRKVSFEDGKKFADENKMIFFETSVYLNKYINELFECLILSVMREESIKKDLSKIINKNLDEFKGPDFKAEELCYRRRKLCVIS